MAKAIKQRDLNLLLAMDRTKTKSTATGNRIAVALVLFVVVLLLVAVGVLSFLKTAELSDRKDELSAWLNDSATRAAYDRSAEAKRDASSMRARADALAGAETNLAAYPVLTGEGLDLVFTLAGDTIELSDVAYDGDEGILSFSASCAGATRVPIFIAQLRICGLFSDVDYEGYSGSAFTISDIPTINEDGSVTPNETTGKEFLFHVRCLANTPAPPEAGVSGEEASGEEAASGEAGA